MLDFSVCGGHYRLPSRVKSLVLAAGLLASVAMLAVGIALGFAGAQSYGIQCGTVFGGVTDNALRAPEFSSALWGDAAARAMQANCETVVARRRPEVSAFLLSGATPVVGTAIALSWNLSRRRTTR
jgi:hypothetical protein